MRFRWVKASGVGLGAVAALLGTAALAVAPATAARTAGCTARFVDDNKRESNVCSFTATTSYVQFTFRNPSGASWAITSTDSGGTVLLAVAVGGVPGSGSACTGGGTLGPGDVVTATIDGKGSVKVQSVSSCP